MTMGDDQTRPGWNHKVFRIENDQLLNMLHLEPRPGFLRYSRAEIDPHFDELRAQAMAAYKIEGKKRDLYQVQVVKLAEQLSLFQQLSSLREPLLIAAVLAGAYLLIAEPDAFNWTIALTTGLAAGLPVILKVFKMFGDQRGGAGAR